MIHTITNSKNNKIRTLEANSMEGTSLEALQDMGYVVDEEKEEFPCTFVGLNQRDKRWKDDYMGNSNATIGDYGCLITGIASHSHWSCACLTPDKLAKNLKFTADGRLFWGSIDEYEDLGMKFVKRFYYYDKSKIIKILSSEKGLCLVEVPFGSGRHWMPAVNYNGDVKCYDPWNETYVDAIRQYGKITGFVELKVN